jgi:hypothetical protein
MNIRSLVLLEPCELDLQSIGIGRNGVECETATLAQGDTVMVTDTGAKVPL